MIIRHSLALKLTIVILAVTLTGVLLVALFARWATIREFDRFLLEQLRDDFVTIVSDHYEHNGSWQGIRQALPPPRQLRPPRLLQLFGPPPPNEQQPNGALFALLDAHGCVVVPAGRLQLNSCPPLDSSPSRVRDYTNIERNGQVIGTVVTVGYTPGLAPPESNYLTRLNLALLWGVLGATLLAVILGIVIAGTLTRPLRTLTKAIRAVAAGNLEQAVQVNTHDELGELAHAFNQMSTDLAEANQARRQMTADIAHELRNPLMVMTGYIEAMRDGVLAPTADRLNAMYDEAQHLQRLVADLRTLSLADAGELTLHKEETLPDELLLRVANNYQSQAQEQQVRIDVDVPFALPTVQVDPERIVQVLSNLVSNALRYTPSGGRIVLVAQATDLQVLLTVQDSGTGIAPEALPHIFDRFYRADSARQEDDGASGLGLAIAKSIVIAHGGDTGGGEHGGDGDDAYDWVAAGVRSGWLSSDKFCGVASLGKVAYTMAVPSIFTTAIGLHRQRASLETVPMKITEITTEAYRWPRHKPITNGLHTYTHSGVGLIKIMTDEGVTGIGLGASGAIIHATIEQLKPQLIGQDPLNVERIWHALWVPKLIGRRGMTTRAISAIDIALWDLRAKVAGLPLYKLLGGYQDRVPTYIAGGYYEEGKGLRELAQEMEENVAMGATAIKMKVGALSLREDAERVRIVREAIGPDIKLMVDANCAYKVREAIQLAKRMEEYDPFWFEEPIAADDYEGHRRLTEATTIPIASGENEYTRYGFRDLILRGQVPILNADAIICGGVTEFMKIAALAQAFDVEIAPHGPQEIHIHLVAALHNGLILEFYRDTVDPMWGKVYHHTLRLNDDGTVSPPDVPGIGIEPNYEALAPYRVE